MLLLPKLIQKPSPNFSNRTSKISLIVLHDTEGSYSSAVSWFSQKASQVSSHLVLREDGKEVTQMVPFAKKAWHCVAFNSKSIGIEMAGVEVKGFSDAEWQSAANLTAWLLHKYDIPCVPSKDGNTPGFCRHLDLGIKGGGHKDPTTDPKVWANFVAKVEAAYKLPFGQLQ